MTGTSSNLSTDENGRARDDILELIRHNLAASRPFDSIRSDSHGYAQSVWDSPRVSPSCEELIESFRVNLESVSGICSVVTDETQAANVVAATIAQTASQRIAISDSQLVRNLVRSNGEVEVIKKAPKEILFDCDIGITSAQWAIAETGTLVLESEKESHRLTSLVPPIHLCILKADSLRQSLGEILELTSGDLSRTITLITGASRTSDIELTLAIGVHGPRELHVIVIADQ